jgi:outer membrane protein assembly factor BamA
LKRLAALFFITLACSAVEAQPLKWLEKKVNSVYDYIEGDSARPNKRYFFALPIWGIYPETGWRLGISLVQLFHVSNDSITRPSLARINTQYTQFHQFSIRPYVDIYLGQNRYNIRSFLTYTRFAEYYWGVGKDVTDATKELYHFDMIRFNMRATKQVARNFYTGPQYLLEKMYNMRYEGVNGKGEAASVLDSSGVAGNHGSFTSGLGWIFAYDNRDHVYFPMRGAYVELSALVNDKIFGSGYQSQSVLIDARKYFNTYRSNVLAVQFYSVTNFGTVPFRQLGTMGNDMIMRGYYNGRFRDQDMAAVQVELRQHIWGPLGFTVFGGFGNVGKDAADLLQKLKPDYGVGFRCLAIRREKVNVRIDYGRGENGIQGFYFTMNEAF